MEDFISLLEQRPALWQKSHPEFADRKVRNKLLDEMSLMMEMSPTECSKKLKNLKDTMRAQVAKLPKTRSGSPAFNASHNITWPYFKHMMFMKEEFMGKKKFLPTTQSEEESLDLDDSAECEDCKDDIAAMSSVNQDSFLSLTQSPVSTATNPQQNLNPQTWSTSASSAGKLIRQHHHFRSSAIDLEERKLAALERIAQTDELEVFAMDIANDLRKIKSPVKLIQIKAKIRRIVEESVLNELLV